MTGTINARLGNGRPATDQDYNIILQNSRAKNDYLTPFNKLPEPEAGKRELIQRLFAEDPDPKPKNRVDHKTLPIKRKAEEELDEYIYSATKNREVLMNYIPWDSLTHIKFNKPDILGHSTDWTSTTPDLQKQIANALQDENRIVELQKAAALRKEQEGSGTG